MKLKMTFGSLGAWGCLLFACSSEHLDVGNDVLPADLIVEGQPGGSGGGPSVGGGGTLGSPPADLPPWPVQSGCPTDPERSTLVATWDGDIEDFFLKSFEHVRVVIEGASATGICGTITFGTQPPLPPADDPDVLYPPSERWKPFGYGGAPAQYLSPVDGFAYTITDSGVRLPTLRLEATLTEPWQSFCELQTPVEESRLPDSDYTCSYSKAACESGAPQPEDLAFRCGACAPSAPLCQCDASSCGVPRSSKQPFDLTLSADEQTLSGPFATDYRDDPRWSHITGYSLHLTRVAE